MGHVMIEQVKLLAHTLHTAGFLQSSAPSSCTVWYSCDTQSVLSILNVLQPPNQESKLLFKLKWKWAERLVQPCILQCKNKC